MSNASTNPLPDTPSPHFDKQTFLSLIMASLDKNVEQRELSDTAGEDKIRFNYFVFMFF